MMGGHFKSLDQLDVGVEKRFNPTDADIVAYYLYNKLTSSCNQIEAFPEISIYGEAGLPPWEIWRMYQQFKYPYQDFLYFFSPVLKVNPNKTRKCRKVGSHGAKWSEGEPSKPVYVPGNDQKAYGTVRKFRYETTKDDPAFEDHHGAWLMEEYTINQASDLALCRLKMNEGGAERNRKRKFLAHEGDKNLRCKKSSKSQKPTRSEEQVIVEQQESTSPSFTCVSAEQVFASYYHKNDQVTEARVPESSYNYYEPQQTMISGEDHFMADENLLFNPTVLLDELDNALVMASSEQQQLDQQEEQLDQQVQQHQLCSDYSVAQQHQLEPESSCQVEDKVQQQQQDETSSSHSHGQQLLNDNDLMRYGQHDFHIPSDDTYLHSYGFTGLLDDADYFDMALPW